MSATLVTVDGILFCFLHLFLGIFAHGQELSVQIIDLDKTFFLSVQLSLFVVCRMVNKLL